MLRLDYLLYARAMLYARLLCGPTFIYNFHPVYVRKNIENRIYMRTLIVGLYIRAEIRTKGNTNIKNSLIRICDTKRNTDIAHQLK